MQTEKLEKSFSFFLSQSFLYFRVLYSSSFLSLSRAPFESFLLQVPLRPGVQNIDLQDNFRNAFIANREQNLFEYFKMMKYCQLL